MWVAQSPDAAVITLPDPLTPTFAAASSLTFTGERFLPEVRGAKNIEGPEFCPEYSPTYYTVYFEDPCGNRLEVCCRTAKS